MFLKGPLGKQVIFQNVSYSARWVWSLFAEIVHHTTSTHTIKEKEVPMWSVSLGQRLEIHTTQSFN